jgi:hypothetical protein
MGNAAVSTTVSSFIKKKAIDPSTSSTAGSRRRTDEANGAERHCITKGGAPADRPKRRRDCEKDR